MSKIKAIESDKSSSVTDNIFSYKRYFLNNLDSFRGEYYLNEVVKVVAQKIIAEASNKTSQVVVGEDAEPAAPSPPRQPYEIFGKIIIHISFLSPYSI